MTSINYRQQGHPDACFIWNKDNIDDICYLLQDYANYAMCLDDLDNGGEFDMTTDDFVYILYDDLGHEVRLHLEGELVNDVFIISKITRESTNENH